ncbi:pyridine nucleotide-disulfide oxidoreductase-domain-containing protein [Xylariaceae sp. FL0804]|nr:pyridine nucleotide-disulfide oxidoreductase-domain-containing protein [Xylariaceae sp. FL0804]
MASTIESAAIQSPEGDNAPDRKERVVILGSGWAGYALARMLDPARFERVVVSPRSYFVFTPLLAGAAVGTLEFRATLESVRRLGGPPGSLRFHQGWADDVDFARKVVRVEANTSDDVASRTRLLMRRSARQQQQQAAADDGRSSSSSSSLEKEVVDVDVDTGKVKGGGRGRMFDVPYDRLVLAVGAYSQTFGIEGVREHAHFLRDVGDARRIRLRVLQCFERAALPCCGNRERRALLNFVVVGGGPTGVEFAAELHDLVRDDLRKTYPDLAPLAAITVYHVADRVLPAFDRRLARYAADLFRREGIRIRTGHHITRVRPAADDDECEGCLRIRVREHGDDEIAAGIVVWSTGLMQNPLVQKLGDKVFRFGEPGATAEMQLRTDPKTGNIVTDAHLRVTMAAPSPPPPPHTPGSEGASATTTTEPPQVLPDVYSIGDCTSVAGQSLPATAQVASQQATHLARRLNRGDVDDRGPAFRFRNWGTMAYLGGWRAIHQSGADELTGRAAWVLWRTAYLTKSMTLRNKIMVPVYWAMSWLFGRDISRF